MDLSVLSAADQTRSPASQTEDWDSLPDRHSPAENTSLETVPDPSDPGDKSAETLSDVSKSLSQGKSSDSGCLKTSVYDASECLSLCSEPPPKDDEFRLRGSHGSSGPVRPLLPQLSHGLLPTLPESLSEFFTKEPALPFSLIQENSLTQPFGPMSSTSEGLMEPSVTETLSSSFSPDHRQVTSLLRSLSHQSDSLDSDTATAPMSDLYIFESETHDFILSPDVDPVEIKCPEYQPLSQTGGIKTDPDCDTRVLLCDSENAVTQCHCRSGEDRPMVDYESDVIQRTGLNPPAVDACESGMMLVSDARQEKAEVTNLTPPPRRSDSPIELWLDACQYLTGEDTEDVLDRTGHFGMEGGLAATSDLSFPAGETQVSDYNPDGSDGIGWSSSDTIGRGRPVERWSSVDSWATALSDWTGIIASPPEDFTAAFTEIGAEIDALTQALAEVNTQIDAETSKEGEGQRPTVQPPMGVQDQPLQAQNIPGGSVLSGESCLSSVESLCDSAPSTQRAREREEIQRTLAESSLPPTHQRSSMGSSAATVASPGGYGVDLKLPHFGGFVKTFETDDFITNNKDPIVLNIVEDTDLEQQNVPAQFIIKEVR